jgi:hypothetical protein
MAKRYFLNSTLNEVIEGRDIPTLIILLEKISAVAKNDEIVRSADALLQIIRSAPVMEAERRRQCFWERVELAADILRKAIQTDSVVPEENLDVAASHPARQSA